MESNIENFHAVAADLWEELKNCSNSKEKFELTLKIVSDTITKCFKVPDF